MIKARFVFLLLVFTAICLSTFQARAQTLDCEVPAFIDDRAERHFHPALAIVYFKRNRESDRPIHDVVRIVTPPKGLGIEKGGKFVGGDPPPDIYRRVHVHQQGGVLHVEPASGQEARLCDVFRLWSKDADAAKWLLGSRTAHVRIGDTYLRDIPIDKLMKLSLKHDQRVVVFIEAATAL